MGLYKMHGFTVREVLQAQAVVYSLDDNVSS